MASTAQENPHPPTSQLWDPVFYRHALPSPVGDKGLLAVPQNSPPIVSISFKVVINSHLRQEAGNILNSMHTPVLPISLSTAHHFFHSIYHFLT